MNQPAREAKGTIIFIYNSDCTQLLYVFLSKTHLSSTLCIHVTTLNSLLNTGTVFIDKFVFTDDLIEGTDNRNTLEMIEFVALFLSTYKSYKDSHGGLSPRARAIRLTHITDPSQSFTLSSIRAAVRHFKCDKETVSNYLNTGKVFKQYFI